ncbi:MAG: formate--tetrahydrofolate ligase [Deltaproteobacteria bacterium]|jgi:formate--tetrahydrofolate ligase|nr:formate--tetrahydrofolate ligase [Deltaproteobacteria bacterium]
MLSDIEIAQQTKMLPITEIAKKLGIFTEDLELYGKYKAKLSEELFLRLSNKPNHSKLILVTAINPTPAGEGKTTTTIALGMALTHTKNAIITLREPSLGPVFGLKGGATGGGYSQVLPMEEINLHFTGDMHAITTANNLLCAVVDNHLYHGNELKLDLERICIQRCMDMNDRSLRSISIGQGAKTNGLERADSLVITVASEIMAILCLAEDLQDLKNRLGNILVGYSTSDQPLFVRDFKMQGAMAALLKEAIKPNLVQTIENTPAIIHGGPFANIAHGCNSIRATKLALKLADYCVTEAGFGSDLGAEKFLDIKCPVAGFIPSAIVLVATVRALKYNGGITKENLALENLPALHSGLCNLAAHIENLKQYGVPLIVSINKFLTDTEEELQAVLDFCQTQEVVAEVCEGFAKGSAGAANLAKKVIALCETKSNFAPLYSTTQPIKEKISILAKKIYGADGVVYSELAEEKILQIEKLGFAALPICVAKTQYSLSDNAKLLGRPTGFNINIKNVKLSTGAGFIVVLTGDIMTMPGLPKFPAALNIDIDNQGNISGLF